VKKLLTTLSAGIAALVLAACSHMSAAATYGSSEITLKDVEASVNQVLAERQGVDTSQMQLTTGADLTRGQLQFLLTSAVIEEVAKAENITVTTSDVEKYRASIVSQLGGEEKLKLVLVQAAIASKDTELVLRRDVIVQKLTDAIIATGVAQADAASVVQEAILSTAKKLKITVNPKYGTWNATTGMIEDATAAGDAVKP
jgi:lipopolysaccharide export system protein LptC